MNRTYVAVDFDGSIVEHEFPKIGPELHGAYWWMKRWQQEGAALILYTMRSDDRTDGSNPLADAVQACKDNGIEFWAVNDNPEQNKWTGSRKVFAHIYVDDAGACAPVDGMGHIDWEIVGPWVLRKIQYRNEQAKKKAQGVT